jgi:hypothetical protein
VSYINDFIRYGQSRTDAPADFHSLAAMVTIGAAMGNRVYSDGRGRHIYPNLWGVIIGRSGIGKSIPLDLSKRVFEQASLGDRISSESFSQEGFMDELKNGSNRYLVLQEFAAFMAMTQRDYNHGLSQFLTEVYDVPPVYRRKLAPSKVRANNQDGYIEFEKPCVSILGATAPDWFAEQFKLSALRSGFLVRYLYCPRSEPGAYVADPGPFDERIETGLAAHLREASFLEGRADFSGVMGELDAWDRTHRDALRDVSEDFAGMRSRAGVFVKKIAMIVHVSRDPSTLRITRDDLSVACRWIEQTQSEAENYLTNKVAHNRMDADRLRVLEIIEKTGADGIDRSRLLRLSHLGAKELDGVVSTLEQMDSIRTTRTTTRSGNYALAYVATRAAA